MANEDVDFKDFSTFMRFFCTRMVQAIVQSRMGIMQTSPCLPNPEHTNWFNIVIDEIGEVAAHLKSTIGKSYPPRVPVLSLEFILYTADGDTLPLETWVVRVDKECQDWTINIRTALYQQMSILLKSVIVASRFTPTYRYYVRNQGPESFVIIYRVFAREPDLSLLGEADEVRRRRIGYSSSPFGTISVELNYRTKMEIQPQPFEEVAQANMVIFTQLTEKQRIPYGVIPNENSKIAQISPSSTENINLFSTSPLSEDLSYKLKLQNHHVERSLSSPDAIDQNMSNSSRSFKEHEASPPTSSSFPQRTSLQRLRIRNNSFPFASLLLYSQSSSDQLKTLPNVPEDAPLNTGFLISKSERLLKIYSKEAIKESRRNSSTGLEMVSYPVDVTPNNLSSDEKEKPYKVLFECDSENREEECEKNSLQLVEKNSIGLKDIDIDDEEEREENSSDDSYVRVIAFADRTDKDLGLDLSEFFKEVRLAPQELKSFSRDSASDLGEQLNEFCKKEQSFSQFISTLKERGKESDEDKPEE